ncbi:MAG: TIR domain-containing protein, partial [Isosphaeraceae bacterium]
MFKFFISYRRQDSRDIAARLDDRLVRHFGRESVFFDIDAIPPGVEFPKRLADELNRCDVLLAVIGDHWLDAAFDEEGPKKGQRRLDDPRDYVRIEIERALERGIRVVPLLVGQTHAMPAAAHLPDGLKSLADWQAHVIQFGPDFHDQVDRLIRGLESEQFEAKKEKLQQDVQKAIDIANQAPKMALSGGRDVLELIMQDVYRRRFNEPPGDRSLEILTERLAKEGHLPDQLGFDSMLRKFSETGTARWTERITGEAVRRSLTQLKKILDWYIEIEQPGAPGWRPAADGEPASRRIKPGDTLPPTRREGRIAVVPKGLDSFDANDSRFFLQLLPGPRDEDGLPESIRFWKHKIEATNEPTFTVGVIFGPSGCGKTSLVKAGLLPRLAEHVVPVYVEATAEETEVRLLAGLRKQCPNLPGDLHLTGTIAALRQGQ